MSRGFNAILIMFTFTSILIIWELIASTGIVPTYLFPPPSKIALTFLHMLISGILMREYLRTFIRVLTGFFIGSLVGLLVGLGISCTRLLKSITYPLIAIAATIPTVALVPLLIIWVGVNEMLPIVAVIICSSIPIIYNIVSSSKFIDPEVINVAKSLGANSRYIVFNILLPYSIPSILSALKIEIAMAWKTCFVSEMLAMSSGLGYFMIIAQSTLRVDVMLVVVGILAISCYVSQLIFEFLETYIAKKWGLR